MSENLRMLLMVLLMGFVTYLLRTIPLTIFKGKIKSQFIYSVLYYIPYAVLSAMTFPYIVYSTGSLLSGIIGTAVALISAISKRSLLTVAILSTIAVLIVNLIYLFI